MSSLIDAVREYLMKVSAGVRESVPGCFDFGCVWDNCEVVVRVRVSDEYRAVCVTVSSGIMVPMEYISDAYEFACRANYELPLGAFWVDPDSRRVSFSVTAVLVDMDPSEGFLGTMVTTGINAFFRACRLTTTDSRRPLARAVLM